MCGYSPGFLGEGRQTTVGLSNTVIFIVFTSYLFGNFRQDMQDIQPFDGFSVVPKMLDLE